MAKRRADHEDEPPPERQRKRKARDGAATVGQVAYAIRHRDAIVEHALEVLGAVGVIDEDTRAHVHGLYERGDARTRLIIQELIARVMRVPVDRLEQALEDEEWDADAMSGRALDALTELDLPRVDVQETADWVRHLDVDGFIGRVGTKNRFVQFLGDVPVQVHKVQRGMMAVGVMLLVVVAASLLFPGQAQLIAFFAFLALLALLGGLLMWWSWRIHRAARDADIDLAVMARLKPEERRLLLLRRIVLQVFDRDKAGDLLERGLDAVVPDLLRSVDKGPAEPTRAEAARPRPARPVPSGSAEPHGRKTAKTGAAATKATGTTTKHRNKSGAAAPKGKSTQSSRAGAGDEAGTAGPTKSDKKTPKRGTRTPAADETPKRPGK